MKKGKYLLTILIFAGLILGLIFGQFLYDPSWDPSLGEEKHQFASWLVLFRFIGFTIFMGLLTMLIIPLIASSVIVGVTSIGDFRKLGRLGGWTLVYYFATMFIAVITGLIFVNAVQPGERIAQTQLAQAESALQSTSINTQTLTAKASHGLIGVFEHLVSLMIPDNLFRALAQGDTLSVIVFSIFFGVMVTVVGGRARIIADVSEAIFEVLMKMVEVVLWLAPLGVFSLLAWTVARIGLSVFSESIGLYMITVISALLVHACITLPVILMIFSRSNPIQFFYQMRQALITAFATDSSSATLPVTMECATEQANISQRTAGLVLPLGSTINMDGTALYEAVAVVFMYQAYNIQLGLSQMIIIAITATLAAVGAAGIPSAGLVTMVIVVHATNNSLMAMDPNALVIPITAIGLIIGVDRLLDMVRTTVNVWGDAVGAKIINKLDRDE